MAGVGRILLVSGLGIALLGLLFMIAPRFFPWLGNLPGDIKYESDNVRVYFPIATMILISIIGTILLNIIVRLFQE